MAWGVCVTHIPTGKILLLDNEADQIDPDDPNYGNDVHIVPLIEDGNMYTFGIHFFERNCICRPRVDVGVSRNLVIHSERSN